MSSGGASVKGPEHEKAVHDAAVEMIAGALFTFAGGEIQPGIIHPTWVTYVNVPQPRMPIEHFHAGEFYPDIVVVDMARGNAPRIAAEVETEDSLEAIETFDKWKYIMDECKVFYAFVPEGLARKTANMLLQCRGAMGIPRALYTYGFNDVWNIRLTPV